jgi:hypothetical protein
MPGWLTAVEHFQPWRTFVLATGLCILNPVDVSFLLLASFALATANVTVETAIVTGVGFVVVASSSVVLPVLLYFHRREQADGVLRRLRTWLAQRSGLLNVAVLGGFGALQLVKGLRGL